MSVDVDACGTRRVLLMGFMGGLLLALAMTALAEWLDDRVHSEEEATDLLHLPVLAQIPCIDERGQHPPASEVLNMLGSRVESRIAGNHAPTIHQHLLPLTSQRPPEVRVKGHRYL